jgi:bifunctional lysine-specific demethylase and histidyl-hydroxylase NO66
VTALSLDDLVGDPGRFFAEHWARRPSVHQSPQREAISELFGLGDVDRLLSDGLRAPALRIVRAGAPVAPSGYLKSMHMGGRQIADAVDVSRARSLFAAGATLVFQALHRYHAPIRALCERLQAALGHPLQANAYVSPLEALGLPAHHDTHDVFALQVFGSKRWRFYEPTIELPVEGLDTPTRHDAPSEPVGGCRLEPGDCLYLPRGIPHTATTESEASIHVTLGVRSPTWFDVFRRVAERAKYDRAFREPLPLRYGDHRRRFEDELADRLGRWAEWIRSQHAAEIAAGEIELGAPKSRAHAPACIADIVQASELGDDAQLELGSQAPRFCRNGEHVELDLGDRVLRFPVRVEAAVRFAVAPRAFRVAELSEYLDTEGRLTLCRRLLAEGVLERSRAG